MESQAPYLMGVHPIPGFATGRSYPFHLLALRNLKLHFSGAVTFFVGENGSGKSTVIEALAELSGFPSAGGGMTEMGNPVMYERQAPLSRALRPLFRVRPSDGFFFRAEMQAQFASLLDDRSKDPDFWGDPYQRYGGKSLHSRSHGEAFMTLFNERIDRGLYLFDEPESALSPQRQLAFLSLMSELAESQQTQFIIATHSAILLTYPGAEILDFDGDEIRPIKLEDTEHYRITKNILESPQKYWKHLK